MSAEAGCSVGFVSNELVGSMVDFQREHIADLPRRPRLDVVLTGNVDVLPAFPANLSYALRLIRHGQRIGVDTRLHQPEVDDEQATLELIHQLNENVGVDGIIPMLPSPSPDLSDAIRHAIDPRKDVDGVRPHDSLFTPATPEAMVLTAETMLGRTRLDSKTRLGGVAIVGNGAVVGQPLAKLLEQRGVPDVTVLGSKSEIQTGVPHLHNMARLVFAALPVAHVIHPEDLAPGTTIVDVSYALDPETGQACGAVDPEVFSDPRFQTTAFRDSVGPVTAAIIHQRTLYNASMTLRGEALPGNISPYGFAGGPLLVAS